MAKKPSSGNPELAEFGKRLRAWRKAKKMSQETLALDAKLDYSYLNEVENGKINPGLVTILALAKAMDVSPAVFLVSAELAGLLEASSARLMEKQETQIRAYLQQPELLASHCRLIDDLLHNGHFEVANSWLSWLTIHHAENWRVAYTWARYYTLKAFPRRSLDQKLAVATPTSPYDAIPSSADITAAWQALEHALANPQSSNLSRTWALQDADLQNLKQFAPDRWSTLLQGPK